ncbi:MAG: transglycosylase domain-containing protein, partial [Bdellovibrionales bacterium]|nr:transglycosylase domain-containing protein [Bdellovibrionales bacterium]
MILLYILIALGLSVLLGTYWLTTVFKDIDHRCKTHARFCYYREFVERDLDLENAVKGLESFPSFLLAALIVSEDAEFFHHKGFNNKELWRCFKLAIKGQELRGGSSITQQLAKMMFTHSKNTLLRKIIETLGTLALERNFSKVEILALYTHFARFWPEV